MSSETPCAAQRSRSAAQRLDRPARRIRPVVRIPADVVDAVPLEVLQAPQVGRPALAPEHRAGRTPGRGRLLRRARLRRDHGAQSGEPGHRDELASLHRSPPRTSARAPNLSGRPRKVATGPVAANELRLAGQLSLMIAGEGCRQWCRFRHPPFPPLQQTRRRVGTRFHLAYHRRWRRGIRARESSALYDDAKTQRGKPAGHSRRSRPDRYDGATARQCAPARSRAAERGRQFPHRAAVRARTRRSPKSPTCRRVA